MTACSTIVGNPTYGSIHCIQCAVTDIRSACHSFFWRSLTLSYLPCLHSIAYTVIKNTLYSVLCRPYLGKSDSIDCASMASFSSQFSILGSGVFCEWSELFHPAPNPSSASHARSPTIEADSSIKRDYDPAPSSQFSICHQLHQCHRFHNLNPRILVEAQDILSSRLLWYSWWRWPKHVSP